MKYNRSRSGTLFTVATFLFTTMQASLYADNPYWRMAERNVDQVLKLDESELLAEGRGGMCFGWLGVSPHLIRRGRDLQFCGIRPFTCGTR
jgi:hypothetical protein